MAKAKKELNAGYEIILSETYEQIETIEHRMVLGEMRKGAGTKYVVWHNDRGVYHPGTDKETTVNSYYWGHYHNDKKKALAYYHETLAFKYKGYYNA